MKVFDVRGEFCARLLQFEDNEHRISPICFCRLGDKILNSKEIEAVPTGTVFDGKMTNADYAEIFLNAKPKFNAMSLEEKGVHRALLLRAIQKGKVELHALDVSIDEELSKSDKAAKARFKASREAELAEPQADVKRMTAQEKALASVAKLLGTSVVDLKMTAQKNAIKKLGGDSTICSKHGKEFIKLKDGVGCKDCAFEEKNSCCLIHDSFVIPCKTCLTT